MLDISDMADSPNANLPLSDPRCNDFDCLAFYSAYNASQAAVPYWDAYEYGHWVTWYYLAIIFVLSALCWSRYLINRRNRGIPRFMTQTESPYLKVTAALRYFSYRRFTGSWNNFFGLPAGGVLLVCAVSTIFLTALTFVSRPYLRERRGYGSPPISVRTGLMAQACTPLLIALAGKANIVTFLTGISHERLNVMHRFVSVMMLLLSIIHTVPFFVAILRDGGMKALHDKFYYPGAFEYTGVPPLAILIGLVASSLPQFRHRFHESFYYLHVVQAITYLGLMFWHAGNIGDSWAYLWATIALWGASWLARALWFNSASNISKGQLRGFNAYLSLLPGSLVQIDVNVPESYRWRPGQHCFLRCPQIAPFQNHPFTIASSPIKVDACEKSATNEDSRFLSFYARSRDGFTKRLAEYASKRSETSIILDGPYGIAGFDAEKAFDTIVLVAGGTGIAVALPWLQYLAALRKDGQSRVTCVNLIWVMRSATHFEWVANELREISEFAKGELLSMQFFITGVKERRDNMDTGLLSKMQHAGDCNWSRPDLENVLLRAVSIGKKTLVIGSGPESLKNDLSNACAKQQARVLRDEIHELALHTETFGW